MQRLKNRAQYQAVLAGELIAKTEHFALHRCAVKPLVAVGLPTLFPVLDTWLGAMAPKRWARRAVTRNTIKRQIYGAAIEYKEFFPLAALVVRLRREFSRKNFVSANSSSLRQALHSEIRELFAVGSRAA